MATTENKKILNKDYLAEQLYNYHTKYITEGIEKNKQDKIYIASNHLTWADNSLGINIDDSGANENDYIVLKNAKNGSLSWKTPITDQGNLVNSDSLVTGKAVFNFQGSTNINTLGTVTTGTWNAGDITLNNHNLTVGGNGKITVGNFEINQENEILKIKYADNYLTLDTSGGLTTKSITAETISATNIDVLSDGIITAGEARISDLKVGNIITIADTFVIKKNNSGSLQIKYADNSYLTLNTSGELNTKSINTKSINTKSITAESITATANFVLKGEECEFATIDDFDINLIEQNES